MNFLSAKENILIDLSSDPDTINLESVEKSTVLTGAECPLIDCELPLLLKIKLINFTQYYSKDEQSHLKKQRQ